jgi:Domain of unknown function (DUF5060)/Protein of unknown function (DUF4038)
MGFRLLFARPAIWFGPVSLLFAPLAVGAQAPAPAPNSCDNTPAYSACDLVFELSDSAAAAHPTPYTSVELKASFRSPHQRAYVIPAFWDGGRRMVIRFAPTEAGEWIYLLTGNVAELNGKTGSVTASASTAPGFIRAANVHHWAYTEGNRPHLWMGATELRFAFLDDATFRAVADARARQKFNHIRGLVLGGAEDHMFSSPDSPDLAQFHRLDERVRYLNGKGITADLILASSPDELAKNFPGTDERRRFARYIAARYAAMNVTWQAVREFESYPGARDLLREIGAALKENDGYQHPRTSGAQATSAPLLDDGWMDFVADGPSGDEAGAIEHQLYPVPFVNLDFAREDSGAGKSSPEDVDTDTFRHKLWNATMDGQYATYANTGSYGGRAVDARFADSPGARQMTVWFDFLSQTRHWELEPYFDVDGGRAVALEDSEYVVYVEKPGPLELTVAKHGYDVEWINPITGESVKRKFSGDHFTGEPPDRSHDWVLHVAREGTIAGMNKSYKFESREIAMQEVEMNSDKVPFAIEQPAGDLAVGRPAPFSVKMKRETHATRSMMWLWTGEIAAGGEGFRVLGTGAKGIFQVPAGLAKSYPAILHVRLYGMNALGKVYALDTVYQLTQ